MKKKRLMVALAIIATLVGISVTLNGCGTSSTGTTTFYGAGS